MSNQRIASELLKVARELTAVCGDCFRFATKEAKRNDLAEERDIDLSKVKFKVRSSSDMVAVEMLYGGKRIGGMNAHNVRYPEEQACPTDVTALAKRFPELVKGEWERSDGEVWRSITALAVYKAFITAEEFRGYGLGKRMYKTLMRAWFKKVGPFLFMPYKCDGGSGTSTDAMRVWHSLSKEFPSSGDVVAVMKNPHVARELTAVIPCGECFRFATKESGWNDLVVHGNIKGLTEPHAWIERGNRVFDWQTDRLIWYFKHQLGKKEYREKGWPKKEFYATFKPRNMKKYTKEEATINSLRAKHFGPWEERELTASASGFMSEYRANTYDNPLAPHLRVWSFADADTGERLPLIVTEMVDGRDMHFGDEESIWFKSIASPEKQKTGQASYVLKKIIKMADKHNVTLFGSVKPFGTTKNKLKKSQLMSWYKRHGWKKTDRGGIVRKPNQ